MSEKILGGNQYEANDLEMVDERYQNFGYFDCHWEAIRRGKNGTEKATANFV